MLKREFTVSTYILNEEKVLLLFHPKLQKWLPPGGHIEPNEVPHQAALREVVEETGLEIELILEENVWIERWNARSFPRPFFCLLEEIPPYKDEPAHQHMDLVYLAKPKGSTEPQSNEGHFLKWFSLQEILAFADDEEIFAETKQVIEKILVSQYV